MRPMAPNADLRPFQIAALSASDFDTRMVVRLEAAWRSR